MKQLNRHAITFLCLLAAVSCYFLGVPAGGVFFLVLGLAFEGLFWMRVFRRGKP